MRREERIRRFVQEIWQWYGRNKRPLPWRDLQLRDDTERAYRILVSEIMLQQTQVSRVIVVYERFLRQFPRLHDLAGASNKDVIVAWRGMGYNSRALRLRDAARAIVARKAFTKRKRVMVSLSNHARLSRVILRQAQDDTLFPRTIDELAAIPGIGQYTAAAILNFAWNIPTPCLDTNIRRILHRTFFGPERADGTWPISDRKLLKVAEEVLGHALSSVPSVSCTTAAWHSALMDFGALVQTKSSPKWHLCPLTAADIMKTTQRSFERLAMSYEKNVSQLREPGRFMDGRFVPNRIVRGRIVEVLRSANRGLTLESIGRKVCADWAYQHEPWLKSLITKLIQEEMVASRHGRYVLID